MKSTIKNQLVKSLESAKVFNFDPEFESKFDLLYMDQGYLVSEVVLCEVEIDDLIQTFEKGGLVVKESAANSMNQKFGIVATSLWFVFKRGDNTVLLHANHDGASGGSTTLWFEEGFKAELLELINNIEVTD